MMFNKWLVPTLAIFAVAFLTPLDANAQLGKKGDKGETKGGGKSAPPPSKNTGGSRGDGKTSPPPTRNTGGGQLGKGGSTSGGSGGGKTSPPPTRNTGGGQLGKGGGTSGGGSSNGGGRVQPPPTRNTGGGSSSGGSRVQSPPTRNTGNGNAGTRGGGSSNGSFDRSRSGSQERNDGRRTIDLRNEPFKKTAPARSGNASYGSKNNEYDRSRSNTVNTRNWSAPSVFKHSSRINYDVRREDRTVRHSGFRSGYHHYNPWWVDDWFYYPHYAFHYNPGYCVPSPFYYYPHVPGYLASVRVITGNFVFIISARDHYNWRRPVVRYPNDPYYGGSGRYDLVDYQIDNIVTAFEQRQMYYLDRMIPRDGYVHVALEDTDDYRMYSSDFYDMLADIVEGTDTVSYRVTDVRYDRNQYVVYAEHAYRDPWGGVDYKTHTIVMERDREGYEIRYFRVDR